MSLDRTKYAIISRLIIDQGLPITWFFRETPIEKGDSGWRAFTGHENEEFFDNENNFLYYAIEKLLEYDSTIESMLESQLGSEFERIDNTQPWVAVNGKEF